MLYHEAGLLGVEDEALDNLGADEPLLRVQVGGGLVNQVHVGRLAEAQRHSHTLQLTARQVLHLLVDNVIDPKVRF